MSEEREIGLLLGLLRGDAAFRLEPGSFDAGRLIGLAERHGVAARLWQVAREKEGVITGEDLDHLGNRCRESAMRSLSQLQELKHIAGVLNAAGIGYACIKGPQLSRMVYGREALKESVDLDFLLVHAKDLPAVHDLLTRQGYTRSNLNAYKKPWARKLFLVAKREVAYYNPEHQIAIDLHVRPGANTYLTAGHFKDLLTILAHFDLEGTYVPVLPDEVYFVYLCYHGALHQFSRLAWLLDIRAFLQLKKDSLDYNKMLGIAQRLRTERAVYLALYLLHDYFGDKIPEPLKIHDIRSRRMIFLVKRCQKLIGENDAYGVSWRGRIGKLVYVMLLIRGFAGRVDLIYGIFMRMLAGRLKG